MVICREIERKEKLECEPKNCFNRARVKAIRPLLHSSWIAKAAINVDDKEIAIAMKVIVLKFYPKGLCFGFSCETGHAKI